MKQKFSQKLKQKISLTPQLIRHIELLSNSNKENKREILNLIEEFLDQEEKPVKYFKDLILIDKYSSFLFSNEYLDKNTFDQSTTKNIQNELLEQINLTGLKDYQILIGEYLIDYIDSEGRLSFDLDLEDIKKLVNEVFNKKISDKDIEDILKLIQKFDPVGCGYTTIEESLLIQVDELMVNDSSKIKLHKIIEKICNSSLSEKELTESEKILISKLNFLPNFNTQIEEREYIRPDLIAKKVKGDLSIKINDHFLHETLFKLIDDKLNEGESSELKNNKKSILAGLKKREVTLLKVAKLILKKQKDFFFKDGALLPLNLNTIANEVDLSESTISRLLNSKYIEVNNKNFPLKTFLERRVNNKSKSGKDISSFQLQENINLTINTEDRSSPLSDDEIRLKLKKESDIHVSRRTVAKYRKNLNIGSSRKRRS
ncbi:MAG: hypothetical protein ACJ0F4_03020 [Gammaproteobacteria bacterium]